MLPVESAIFVFSCPDYPWCIAQPLNRLLMAILESLKDKQSDLIKINRDIVELLSEDELENEATQSDKTDMKTRRGIQKISKELKSKKSKDKELESNTTAVKTPGMKLPKCTLTAFNGDPLKWT